MLTSIKYSLTVTQQLLLLFLKSVYQRQNNESKCQKTSSHRDSKGTVCVIKTYPERSLLVQSLIHHVSWALANTPRHNELTCLFRNSLERTWSLVYPKSIFFPSYEKNFCCFSLCFFLFVFWGWHESEGGGSRMRTPHLVSKSGQYMTLLQVFRCRSLRLERQLSGKEHPLLFQKTWVRPPGPTW